MTARYIFTQPPGHANRRQRRAAAAAQLREEVRALRAARHMPAPQVEEPESEWMARMMAASRGERVGPFDDRGYDE